MAADKTYFCFLLEWADMFDLLDDEQSGRMVKAMIAHEKYGTDPDFSDDQILRFAWLSNVKPKMDAMKEHYEGKRRQASEAGKASANNRKRTLTDVESVERNERTLTDVENVEQDERTLTDVDNIDLDIDIDLDIEKEKEKKEKEAPEKYQPIIDAWNLLPVPKISGIRGKRLDMLRSREREYSLPQIISAVHGIRDCPFLLGQNNRGWTITFDWFIKPSNFVKVLEGNYKDGDTGESKEYGTVL